MRPTKLKKLIEAKIIEQQERKPMMLPKEVFTPQPVAIVKKVDALENVEKAVAAHDKFYSQVNAATPGYVSVPGRNNRM